MPRAMRHSSFAYAAAVAGLIWREKAAATFFFGYYYAESLILAETGRQVGRQRAGRGHPQCDLGQQRGLHVPGHQFG